TEVEVLTRKAGAPASEAVRWVSQGESDYTIEAVEKAGRGTSVTLKLRPESIEFADGWRLRQIVKKYADHIAIPVLLPKQQMDADDEENKSDDAPEYEAVNAAKALWTRARTDVKEDEYIEFYKHITHDY